MAAAALAPFPVNIEKTSDDINAVNVLKGNLQKNESDLYDQSKFNQDKEKSNFRQFEDAREGVKAFYATQQPVKPWHTTSRPAMT